MIYFLVHIALAALAMAVGALLGLVLYVATVVHDLGKGDYTALGDEVHLFSKADYDYLLKRARRKPPESLKFTGITVDDDGEGDILERADTRYARAEEAIERVKFNQRVNAELKKHGLSVSLRDEGEP